VDTVELACTEWYTRSWGNSDSEFERTSRDQGPTGPVLDADGNVYVNDRFSLRIVRITPDRTTTSYPFPDVPADPDVGWEEPQGYFWHPIAIYDDRLYIQFKDDEGQEQFAVLDVNRGEWSILERNRGTTVSRPFWTRTLVAEPRGGAYLLGYGWLTYLSPETRGKTIHLDGYQADYPVDLVVGWDRRIYIYDPSTDSLQHWGRAKARRVGEGAPERTEYGVVGAASSAPGCLAAASGTPFIGVDQVGRTYFNVHPWWFGLVLRRSADGKTFELGTGYEGLAVSPDGAVYSRSDDEDSFRIMRCTFPNSAPAE